jgi:HD-GYP domain-containing protein (c-di-GMP phosphodiesterase class II)
MNIAMVNLQQQLSHQAEALSSLQAKQLHLHPLASSAMLREVGIDDEIWHLAILEHHEQWNGKGYPFGLGRSKISPGAHLLPCCRRYRRRSCTPPPAARPLPKSAMVQLFQQRDTLADAKLADCLIKEVGLYPPGSFVNWSRATRHRGAARRRHHHATDRPLRP